MTWRDGVHLTGTPVWCDARRRRDVCFVSSAERVGRAGHGQLIATPLTLALLGAQAGGHLGVPLHRRFTLGTLRLELLASGRGAGAASLHVDAAGGPRVLYAGAIRTAVPPASLVPGLEPAGVLACDAAVVTAVFGEDRHRFAPLAETVERTLEWARGELAAARRPVLLVDTVVDALEVAGCLAAAGIPVAASRGVREAARRASGGDVVAVVNNRAARDAELRAGAPAGDPGATSRAGSSLELAAPGREPRAVVWLASDRAALAKALGDHPRTTALVSGRALDGTPGTDAAFAWSGAAGRDELLAWIESTAARDIFVTGPFADAIVQTLGARARVIGPPRQMTLFPREDRSSERDRRAREAP